MIKEAMKELEQLITRANVIETIEIEGKTYCDRDLSRYGTADKASALNVSTLSAVVDYLVASTEEYVDYDTLMIHIIGSEDVRLITALDIERDREQLLTSHANLNRFKFDQWYDQERFMIELQANFIANEDLSTILAFAGNMEKCDTETYSDDGTLQAATIKTGIVGKDVAAVPNPVELIPYRTFQEVDQPMSKFVFRVRDNGGLEFKLVEAQGNIWKNEAVANIKNYFKESIQSQVAGGFLSEDVAKVISIIG